MNAKQLIEINRKELRDAESRGLKSVQTSTLHEIFDSMEQHLGSGDTAPTPLELEKFRSDLAGSLAYQAHVNAWRLEAFKQVIALGQSTLKSLMLINGGAAVALLAFLGNIAHQSNRSVHLLPFANSMGAFVFGVFLAAVAYGATYLSQLCYSGDDNWQQWLGKVVHVAAVLTAIASMLAFLGGAYSAYGGFVALAP